MPRIRRGLPRSRRAGSPSSAARPTRGAWTSSICSRGSERWGRSACSWREAASSRAPFSKQVSSIAWWPSRRPSCSEAPARRGRWAGSAFPCPTEYVWRKWRSAPSRAIGSSKGMCVAGAGPDMFTGIVEETGRVVARRGSRLVVGAGATRGGTELGSSVAVNGVCLTAVELDGERLSFDLGPETLARSALGDLEAGDQVNLERPMRLNGFVGGHLVLGHVDGIGLVTAFETDGETARIRVEW